MKMILFAAATVSLLSACVSSAPAPEPVAAAPVAQPPLRSGDCMVARDVRDWGVVDARRVVVRTLGERYYDVTLQDRCTAMAKRPLLSFSDVPRPVPLGSGSGYDRNVGVDPVSADGRICGDLGETVIPHGGTWTGTDLPCRVAGVRRISRETFEGVFGKSPREGRQFLDASPTLTADELTIADPDN